MTTLANVFQRDLWTLDDILSSKEVQKIIGSDYVMTDPDVSKTVKAVDAGNTVLIPYVKEDLYTEPSIMDDSGTLIVGKTITRIQEKAAVGFYATSYAYKKIVDTLGSGMKSIDAARALLSNYWMKDMENKIFATLTGVIASNIAQNASDCVNVKATTGFNFDMVVDTLGLAGETLEEYAAIIVHPAIYATILKKDKASITVIEGEGSFTKKFYNDLELIVSSLVPFTTGLTPNLNVYTSILLKKGAFVFADATVDVPVEVFSNPLTGNGGGQEDVISRMGYLLHINGYSFDEAGTVVNVSPSISDLATGANWTRKVSVANSVFLAIKCPTDNIV